VTRHYARKKSQNYLNKSLSIYLLSSQLSVVDVSSEKMKMKFWNRPCNHRHLVPSTNYTICQLSSYFTLYKQCS
jgi:hypothetical protein